MKVVFPFRKTALLAAAIGWMSASAVQAANLIYGLATPAGISQAFFTVTNIPGNFVYPNPPVDSPSLILTAGATYRFVINTSSFHPVAVVTNFGSFPPVGMAFSGASPQAINSGFITITIPATNYPNPLYYICNVHAFKGRIDILPPPTNQIVSASVTTNVVLVSTGGSNTWVLVPEFSSNLVSGAWAPVASFTNTFLNGTNVTSFARLDAICGSNVFLRIRQSAPTP